MWNLRYQVCENSPPVCTLYYGKGKVCARVDVYLISIKILFFCFVFLVIIESDDSGTKITKIVIGLMLNVKNPDRYIRVYKDLFHNRFSFNANANLWYNNDVTTYKGSKIDGVI